MSNRDSDRRGSVILSLVVIGVLASLVLSGMAYLPLRLLNISDAAPLSLMIGVMFGPVAVILAITQSNPDGVEP